jgi:hypothetical protein
MPLIISEYTQELYKTNNDSTDDLFLPEKSIKICVLKGRDYESQLWNFL